MLFKRYFISLALALSLFFLETLKPNSLVFTPVVTNTHITKTSRTELEVAVDKPKYGEEIIGKVAGQATSIYPLHQNILTTVFWVGEAASPDNAFIANDVSAWDNSWVNHFGGIDNPNNRNGFYPFGFRPKENPFYFALPFGDYTESGQKANVNRIYWYRYFKTNESLLKNRWIKISAYGKVAYGQWEDTGPFEDDDVEYVFGTKAPKQEVGLDVSPALRDYLGLTGRNRVSWQFIDEVDVPFGPWKEIVTKSNPSW